jgi:hypothetical protein
MSSAGKNSLTHVLEISLALEAFKRCSLDATTPEKIVISTDNDA